ncbi:3-deoxy-D-manno-octulosonate 8-phosphate phosphatase [Compostibacter hankyongensis]|uniref:HAD-IIIA family hydrolase n=1 Tax=Compostibacter hankyongensis TaxID=1007089 RepID=A0ABP8FVY2_9BACT
MNVLELFRTVRTFAFDVDGVMTDGTLQLLENGALSRKMYIRDGYALQLAVKKGYRVVVISGGSAGSVRSRLESLGIKDIFLGVQDKASVLAGYVAEHELEWSSLLYMGDDVPDYTAMQMTGIPVCPADAAPEIKAICRYTSPFSGGKGCVRDVIEKVLKLHHHWEVN